MLRVHLFLTNDFFSIPGFTSGSHITLFFLLSRLQTLTVLLSFLVFDKDTCQLFCRMALSLGLSGIFSLLDWSHMLLGRRPQRRCALLGASFKTHNVHEYYTTGHVNFIPMVKVVSARILHCKVIIFLLAITEYLGRDTLKLCKEPVSL